MSLDRTTWEHGDAPLNLLVLGAVVHGYTIPLVWVALDHTGNSDTRARMWVVLKLLSALPARRWKGLVADRESTLAEWFRFLRRQGIRRAIRIRKNTVLDELPASQWFEDLQPGQFSVISDATWVFGERMRVVATKSPHGDLVIIATDFGVWETWKLYKLRSPCGMHVRQRQVQGLRSGAHRHHGSQALGATLQSGDPGVVELPSDRRLEACRQTDQGVGPWPKGHEPGALRFRASEKRLALGSRRTGRTLCRPNPSVLSARSGLTRSCPLLNWSGYLANMMSQTRSVPISCGVTGPRSGRSRASSMWITSR